VCFVEPHVSVSNTIMLLHNNAFMDNFVASNNETGTSLHTEVPGAVSKECLFPHVFLQNHSVTKQIEMTDKSMRSFSVFVRFAFQHST
jgi:hypothetical protein